MSSLKSPMNPIAEPRVTGESHDRHRPRFAARSSTTIARAYEVRSRDPVRFELRATVEMLQEHRKLNAPFVGTPIGTLNDVGRLGNVADHRAALQKQRRQRH